MVLTRTTRRLLNHFICYYPVCYVTIVSSAVPLTTEQVNNKFAAVNFCTGRVVFAFCIDEHRDAEAHGGCR